MEKKIETTMLGIIYATSMCSYSLLLGGDSAQHEP